MSKRIIGYIELPKNYWERSCSNPPLFADTANDDNIDSPQKSSPDNKENNV